MSDSIGVAFNSREFDEVDVRILEGLSILGPRNFTLVSQHLNMPDTSVRYRINRMIDDKILFLHANPYHSNLGLRTVEVFVEAVLGHEALLFDCLRVNDFWQYLCKIYSPFIGWAGIWTVPKDNVEDFKRFLKKLVDLGVAKSVEVNWTTCHEGIPVKSRWYSAEIKRWVFDWDELINEVENIKGELSETLRDPYHYPMLFDEEDLLIIKELEKDWSVTKTGISRAIGIQLETVQYHLREHILKRDLVEGFQVSISRYPPLSSEKLFLKFEFDDYDQLVKFALSIRNKPFPEYIAKVIGENILTSRICLPKNEFSELIKALSTLIRRGLLKTYRFWLLDIFVQFNETIPYKHYDNNMWSYNVADQLEQLEALVKEGVFRNHLMKRS